MKRFAKRKMKLTAMWLLLIGLCLQPGLAVDKSQNTLAARDPLRNDVEFLVRDDLGSEAALNEFIVGDFKGDGSTEIAVLIELSADRKKLNRQKILGTYLAFSLNTSIVHLV